MKIEFTTDFILSKLPFSFFIKEDEIHLRCFEYYEFIKLALDTIKIDYEEFEILDDENYISEIIFSFNIEDIKEHAPTLYEESLKLKESEEEIEIDKMDQILSDNNFFITNEELYSFDECYNNFHDKLSKKNFVVLSDHICNEDLAEHISGFIEKDNKLYFLIGNELIEVNDSK